jgi:anti-repressor protein
MMAAGDYGKRLRRYFLDCEFRLPEGLPPAAAAQLQPAEPPAGHVGAGAGAGGGYVPVPAPLSMVDFFQVAGFDKVEAERERDLGGRQVLTVLARDLHSFIGGADEFMHWFRDKADQCSLRPAIDYREVLGHKPYKSGKGRPRREMVLTLDAAKQVGMTARGDHGRKLRLYFLDCERRLLEGLPPPAAAQMRPAVAPGGHAGAGAGAVGGYVPVPVPLSMVDFLQVAGFDRAEADRVGGVYERLCRRDLAAGGRSLAVQRHPVSGVWLFERGALDAWWPSARQQAIISP